ncbi:porin [Paraburkholderia aspalathi]|uniref:Outer membrane protein OmpU n=1 Tax=Paraburkholderia aspalathi TaxID=1324617 RepID=A0A1I7B8J6_9BURK|nr:porin [Paraburkholderia aspalathi]SFT83523.1 outer membrane protein OmpU [Paraburkholderia aspalathi]
MGSTPLKNVGLRDLKTIRRLAALIGVAATGLAHAQNSVTLYGVIDVGPTFVSNEGGAHNVKLDDSVYSGNRWGLKGTEDMGGGLKAIFLLENGFNALNGQLRQGGLEFGRSSWVGLQNDYATLTMGRQYDLIEDFTARHAMSNWASGYANHQGDLDRLGGELLNNSVKLLSAEFNGFQAGAMYSFGNVAGSVHKQSAWGAAAQYSRGPFSAGTAYMRLNNPSGGNAIDPYAQMGVFSFLGQTTATRDPATGKVMDTQSALAVDSQSILTLGASYLLSNVTYGIAYSDVWFKGFGKTSTLRAYDGGASWQITPSFSLAAAYVYSTFEAHHYNEGSLGLDYLLSKRTDIYLQGSYLRASAGVDAVQGYSFTPSTTSTQTSVHLGLRHRF